MYTVNTVNTVNAMLLRHEVKVLNSALKSESALKSVSVCLVSAV